MEAKLQEDGSELVLFKDMVKGDIGVIEGDLYGGILVLALPRKNAMVVSLGGDVWSGLDDNDLKVRLLPKGTLLEVT